MNIKTLTGLALCIGSFLTSFPAHAQAGFDFSGIDTLIEDNMLNDAANRYSSAILSFFPERATRIGFSSANAYLDDRSAPNNAQALNALRSVKELVNQITPSELSASNQTDLLLLKNALDADLWDLEQNRIENDPLYYTEAFDAIYDIMLKQTSSSVQQRRDLHSRLNELPQVAAQAQKNLVQPPAYLAQQAMERAYYAYLSFDELIDFLLQGVEDEVSIAQIKKEGQTAKRSVKQMFDLFKQLSQAESSPDFRLGENTYLRILKDRYQIAEKPSKLEKQLEKEFLAAQKNLAQALEPFVLKTVEEEVTVVDGLNDQPTIEPTAQSQKAKQKKGKFVPPSAADFYKVSKRMTAAPSSGNLLNEISQDAQELAAFFEQDGTLPPSSIQFSVKNMPAFYAYTKAYLFVPPYGNQLSPTTDLFLRLPSGNKLARQEQLQRDFNMPVRKLLLSGELVPGRYYQTVASKDLSSIRRLYPSATAANGWSAYAQQLAKERGYIVTDEELLFLAWIQYRRTAAALAEIRLQTKQYSYADAVNFLTAENGFTAEEAEQLIKQAVVHPGETISYIYGLQAIEKARAKYARKMGKKFNLAQFHSLLLQAGNVPPAELEKEIDRLQERAQKQNKNLLIH